MIMTTILNEKLISTKHHQFSHHQLENDDDMWLSVQNPILLRLNPDLRTCDCSPGIVGEVSLPYQHCTFFVLIWKVKASRKKRPAINIFSVHVMNPCHESVSWIHYLDVCWSVRLFYGFFWFRNQQQRRAETIRNQPQQLGPGSWFRASASYRCSRWTNQQAGNGGVFIGFHRCL